MLYRESGDFSETYKADSQTFPIKFDRYRYYAVLAFAFLVIPFIINDYWANAVLVPFLIYAIAAIGLNILVGYCGQVSLGTGGFILLERAEQALCQGLGDVPITRDDRLRDHVTGERQQVKFGGSRICIPRCPSRTGPGPQTP